MRQWRFAVAAMLSVLSVAAIGCASSGGSRPATVRNSSSELITTAEIQATPASNAYELINRLRPRWLAQGGKASSLSNARGGDVVGSVVLVYLDNTKLGGLDALRSLSTSGFRTLQWLDAVKATTVLRDTGNQPLAGAIVIRTIE